MGKHLCQSLFFNNNFINNSCPQACNIIKKETLPQMFSCKFCEISKNIFFIEQLRATTSAYSGLYFEYRNKIIKFNKNQLSQNCQNYQFLLSYNFHVYFYYNSILRFHLAGLLLIQSVALKILYRKPFISGWAHCYLTLTCIYLLFKKSLLSYSH